MNKEYFLNEVEKKLNKLSLEDKQTEINKLDEYIESGKTKNISEEEIIKSLGSIDDLVKTIYVQREIKDEKKKIPFKEEIINIWRGIKGNFQSKDKKIILNTIGSIVTIIIVAIIIKVPFIFIRTLLLDFLNGANIAINIQNIIATLFEILYVVIAIIYIYKRLKKCFTPKSKSI